VVVSWKRIAAWSALALLALIVTATGIGIVLFRSQAFHHYLFGKLQQSASKSLNTAVSARDFRLHLSPISADLYGVVVRGSGPNGQPPLLAVDHVRVVIKILSVVRRSWSLNDIEIDHPVAHLAVDEQGQTNLPPRSSTPSNTNVFDLAIGHARLDGGEVYYGDRKFLVDADLHELSFRSAYDGAQGGRYFGRLAYRDGRLTCDNYAPMAHDFSASFDATRQELRLRPAVLAIAGSRLDLEATLRNYDNPKVDVNYRGEIDTAQLRRIMRSASVPSGVLRLTGSAHYEAPPSGPAGAAVSPAGVENRSLLDALSAQAELSSGALSVQASGARAEVRDLLARLNLSHGNLDIPEMRLTVLGGTLSARASVANLAGEQRGHLSASLRGASMAELQAQAQAQTQMKTASINQVRLGGVVNADADARWLGSIRNLAAKLDATIQSSLTARQQPGAVNAATAPVVSSQPLPLDGVIHARFAAKAGELDLTESYLRTPQTRLDLNGKLSPGTTSSSLQFALESNALHELETLAGMFRASPSGEPLQPLGLYGTASFRGSIRGRLKDPQVSGQLAAHDVRLKGSAFRLLRASVSASPSQAALENGEMDLAPRGRLAFDVRAGLKKWSYSAAAPLALTVHASQLPVAHLAQAAGVHTHVAGILNGDLAVQGTAQSPLGHGQLTLTKAAILGEPVQSLNLSFQGTGEQVNATLAMRAPAGNAGGRLTYYPRQQSYELVLQAPNLRLERLRAPRVRATAIAGQLSIMVNGRGTIKNPELQASARIPELQVRGQTVREINLNASLADREARFTFDSQVSGSAICAHGQIALKDGYPIDAALDTPPLSLQPLFAAYAPAQAPDMKGQAELHATLRGPLRHRQQLQAHLTMPVLQVGYQELQLAATAPIRADLANGALVLRPAELKGTGTDLRFQGEAPVAGNASASLTMTGNMDLKLLRILQPDLESSGQLQFDIRSQGSRSNPALAGQIRIVNATLLPADSPLGLEHANGVLTLANKRLDVTQFQGKMGGGTVTASGGVAFDRNIRLELAAAATGVQAVYQGIRVGLDGKLSLSGTPQTALLGGRVTLNRLSVTPDFDLANVDTGSTAEVATSTTGLAQSIKLNIGVQSSALLEVVSRTLTVAGATNLRVSGTAAQPVILGRINVNRGDLLMFGNRYVLQPGTVDFINPARTEPVLNLAATTTISQYNISLRLQGPLDRLQTSYSSDPSLPPVDIINLLAFGKTTETPGATPITGTLGAESVLASGISSGITSQVEKVAGISHLSIDPALSGNGNGTQQNPGARITVQQRVTSNLFVTFSTDVTSTQNQVIQVEYHFSPRWSFSGVRDQNGGFGFDFRVRKEY
jgi:translocation and assembly module TamB